MSQCLSRSSDDQAEILHDTESFTNNNDILTEYEENDEKTDDDVHCKTKCSGPFLRELGL